jgi:hypothetical protein
MEMNTSVLILSGMPYLFMNVRQLNSSCINIKGVTNGVKSVSNGVNWAHRL